MTAIEHLKTYGITARIKATGKIALDGAAALPDGIREEVVTWAKGHRAEIEADLTGKRNCPARCRRSGLCYGVAYFDGKPRAGVACDTAKCQWMVTENLNER